ncbi:MAG: hypothetical protein QM793_09120 [Muricomes sp.]
MLATSTGLTAFAQEPIVDGQPSVEAIQEDVSEVQEPDTVQEADAVQAADTAQGADAVQAADTAPAVEIASTEEITAENAGAADENRPVTAMDENGNVYEVEPEVGWVEEGVTTFANSNELVVNFNVKGDAVTEYTADTGDSGYTNGAYGADAAYLGESNGKIKFMLSGVIGFVDKADKNGKINVQVINKASAKSISYYTVSGGKLMHYVTTNLDKNVYLSKLQCERPLPILQKAGSTTAMTDIIFMHQINTRSC